MQNTAYCVEFLNSQFTLRISSSYARSTTDIYDCIFWHIDLKDVNRDDPWHCNILLDQEVSIL